ncbi:MAG: hypothetical protein J6Q18_01275, partial [Oscillospiraceae bacterium]|nr:hypothetical protein [Oscillospiraceae bacterium]
PYSWHSDVFWEDTTLYAKWVKLENTDSDLPDESKVTGITLYDDYGNKLSSSKTINFYNEGYFYLIWPEVLGTGEFDDQLTVTSSNEAVAMFDPFHEGYAYAFFIGEAGTAKLTFTSKQNPKVKTTLTLNVKAKANEAQLTVSKNETNDGAQLLTVGQTVTPSIKWIGGEAWAKGTYEIFIPEDNGVLEMTSGGKIKAVAPGDCHVMLSGWDEESGRSIWTETWVTVYAEKVKEVKLSNSTIVLDSNSLEPMYSYRQIRYIDVAASNANYEDGHTGAYNEFDITWTASNNIVVVNGEDEIVESGTVGNRVGFYAVNNDKASITVTFKAKDGSGKSDKATVKTGTAVEDIDLTLPSERYDEDYGTVVTVAKGKSVKAVANVIPASATLKTLEWTAEEITFDEEGNWVESKPTDIVTVSNGTIKGVKPGMAFVTVRATDGSYWVNHGFWVEVTEAVTGVQIDDGAKTVVLSRHDGPATFEPQINLTYADGTTVPAGDKVKITVAGTNGKYVNYGCFDGSWYFDVNRPGKYTIKAAAVDGSGKSATVTVDVQQHVYYFDAAAPKNTPTNGDEWVVKAGTTVTPQVVYNFGEKLNTPASAFKKYTIEVSDFQPDDPSLTASQCYSQNTAKSNI